MGQENVFINNPFVVGKYVSDEYFCDREQETATLVKHITNGRNVALISPRRLGKTGLIEHLFGQDEINSTYYTFFVDIYSTNSLTEFVYLLGKEIFQTLKPRSTEWKERFFSVIKSLRVAFKLDPFTGEPKFDLGLGDIHSPVTTLDEIFEYLEQADRPCLVAIDEFQRVSRYKEENVEEVLRTKIQHCKQTSFIFSGSERNTMSNMFNSSAKPFYQSAISMGLAPIPLDVYVKFAREKFAIRGKEIASGIVDAVYDRFEGCTWFVQMIMNELFALTPEKGKCDESFLPEAYRNVITSQEHVYLEILSNLAPIQKAVLQAIAKEGVAENITSFDFVRKYSLRSASSVQSAVNALLKSDILTRTAAGYRVYDYFFADWLATQY